MERFFTKYPPKPSEKDALIMVKSKIYEALEDYDKGEPYIDHLQEANEMISDLIECLTTMPIRLKA